MEQLCVHALLVQLYLPELVAEGEVPPPPTSKGFGGRVAANRAAGVLAGALTAGGSGGGAVGLSGAGGGVRA